jgi:hypothetical protein
MLRTQPGKKVHPRREEFFVPFYAALPQEAQINRTVLLSVGPHLTAAFVKVEPDC